MRITPITSGNSAHRCCESVYGKFTPSSDGGYSTARLFDDKGFEITCFGPLEGQDGIILIVSKGEDFVPIDYRRRAFSLYKSLGWIRAEEVNSFLCNLEKALDLQTESISSADNQSKLGFRWISDEVAKIIRTSLPPGMEEDMPEEESLDEPQAPYTTAEIYRELEAGRNVLDLGNRVIAALPRMHVPPGTEDDALLGMEALFNELPTGDVHHVDPLKIGAVVKKASRSPQIDAMVEESSLTSPQTDSSMGYTAAEAKASTTSHTESTTDHTGSTDQSPETEPSSASSRGSEGNIVSVQESAFIVKPKTAINMRYRKKIQASFDKLKLLVPLRSGLRDTRANQMLNAAEHMKGLQQENGRLLNESRGLEAQLAKARNILLAEARLLHQQKIGVLMTQLLRIQDDKIVKLQDLVPPNPRRPFFAKVIYWNSAMEQITGFSAAEAIGKPTYETLGFYRNKYVRQSYFHWISVAPPPLSAAAWGHEYVVIIERKDGKMLKVACRGYQLHKQGQYSRGVQVMHEFTPFEPVEITDSAVLIP